MRKECNQRKKIKKTKTKRKREKEQKINEETGRKEEKKNERK